MSLRHSLGGEPLAKDTERPTQRGKRASGSARLGPLRSHDVPEIRAFRD